MEQSGNNSDLFKCQGKCKQFLPRESFYKNRSRENGLQIFCKECTRHTVKNYEEKKKLGLLDRVPCVNFTECRQKCYRNSPEGKCGDCRHKERMRKKYRENPTYYKIKHAAWRKRRAAINSEIEREEMELLNPSIQLTNGEMFLLTRFNTSWIPESEINLRNLFTEDLERLEELELIRARKVDSVMEYALTEKGLEFLGIAPLERE